MTATASRTDGPRRILVPGADGLIGSALVDALAGTADVYALSRRPTPAVDDLAHLVPCDLARPGFTESLPEGVDTVVHLAQSRRYREFPEGAPDVFAVNVASTAALLDWARRTGVARFVLGSSGGIQRLRADRDVDEASPLDFYLASKQAAELLSAAYGAALTVVVLRFFFVYGPAQRPSMLLPRLVRSVALGDPVVLEGEDGMRCNPLHVDDAVRAISRAALLDAGASMDVAGPDTWSLRRIAERIGAGLGRTPVFKTVPDAAPKDLVGDVGPMTTLLGPPEVPLEDGLVELCRSYAEEPGRPAAG